MAIGDFLFGSKPKTTTSSLETLTPEQKALFESYLTQLQQTPSTSALQSTSLAGLEQYATNLVGGQGAGGAGGAAGSTLQDILTSGPADFEQYFQEAVYDPAIRQFQEETLPAISRKFAPSGFYSSERLRADERSREDLIQSLTAARAQTGYEAYQSNIENQLAALGLTPEIAGMDLEQLGLLYGIGAEGQNQQLALMLAALGIPMKENIVTQTAGSSGFFGGLAGGIGEGLGDIIGSFF